MRGPALTGASLWDRAIGAALAWGLWLRGSAWWADRSLWGDEARVALNLAARPLTEIRLPLRFEQVAPLPFLWACKLCTLLLGLDERALRLPSLIAGGVLLVGAARLARRILTPRAAALATLLIAVAPSLVAYSDELKPYMVDAAVSIGLMWHVLRGGGADRRLLALGLGAVLVSFAAPFTLAAVGLALLLREGPRVLPRVLALGLCWLAVAGAQYLYASQGATRTTWTFTLISRIFAQECLRPGGG